MYGIYSLKPRLRLKNLSFKLIWSRLRSWVQTFRFATKGKSLMSSSTYWADRVRVSWSHSVRTPMYFLRRTPCPASYLDPDNVTVMWAPAKGTVVRAALFVFPDKHLTQFPIDFRLSICVWHTAKNLFVPRKKSFQLFVLSKSKLENQNRCLDFKLKFLRKICQIWICCHKLPLAGILCCPWVPIFLHGVTAHVTCHCTCWLTHTPKKWTMHPATPCGSVIVRIIERM